MAITIDTQENPIPLHAGKKEADATIIYSGYTSGKVTWELELADGNEFGPMGAKTAKLTVPSGTTLADMPASTLARIPQITSLSTESVALILPFRTEFRIRNRHNSNAWSEWTYFKTKDKRYQSPDAVTQLQDNSKRSDPTNKVNKTIYVTNNAKAKVYKTARGATVYNDDTGYVTTTSIVYNHHGAIVTNTKSFKKTARGETIY